MITKAHLDPPTHRRGTSRDLDLSGSLDGDAGLARPGEGRHRIGGRGYASVAEAPPVDDNDEFIDLL